MDYLSAPPSQRLFCNRTLNLRGIRAIGYDMDYTLIHYHVDMWERRAYEYARDRLGERGFPVDGLEFDADLNQRGLIIDTVCGNIVKADRFGFVKAACHGTEQIAFGALRETYGRVFVDLRDPRWVFMSTLFDISLACLYGQAVDRLDQGATDEARSYRELFQLVRSCLDSAHVEGAIKDEIMGDPTPFVVLDPEAPAALLDQKDAGKQLLLITNSGWRYSEAMMRFAFDPYLPGDMTWRDLFEIIIVSARKPAFFDGPNPCFEVINDAGHLQPLNGPLRPGGIYLGGDAGQVEAALGLSGLDFLYVGDHIFSDVNVSKTTVQWRTALVLRELEDEIAANAAFSADEAVLARCMADKTAVEGRLAQVRLDLQRHRHGRARLSDASVEALLVQRDALKARLQAIDTEASPLAARAATVHNARWGPIMRAGIDKSHMARQIERYADVYTSRVANFLYATPNVYLRSPKSSLPHDLNALPTASLADA